jgi:hypothetical protein
MLKCGRAAGPLHKYMRYGSCALHEGRVGLRDECNHYSYLEPARRVAKSRTIRSGLRPERPIAGHGCSSRGTAWLVRRPPSQRVSSVRITRQPSRAAATAAEQTPSPPPIITTSLRSAFTSSSASRRNGDPMESYGDRTEDTNQGAILSNAHLLHIARRNCQLIVWSTESRAPRLRSVRAIASERLARGSANKSLYRRIQTAVSEPSAVKTLQWATLCSAMQSVSLLISYCGSSVLA